MLRILMAGFEMQMADWLTRRLADVRVESISDGQQVCEALERAEASLLVLKEGAGDPLAREILQKVRAGSKELPVIYCADEGAAGEAAQKLVRELSVNEILLHPLDREELARCVARVLGLPYGVADGNTHQQVQVAIAGVRSRAMDLILERIDVIERASRALVAGKLSLQLRENAERDAHRLAGMLGTLGFAAGSRFAHEAEKLLREGTRLTEAQALRLCELVAALRLDVDRRSPAIETTPLANAKSHSLLILNRNTELVEKLSTDAACHGFAVETAKDWPAAREAISSRPPDAVLLDLELSGKSEEGLAFLEELARPALPIPALVLTAKGTFTDRVEVARRNGHGFLSNSLPPAQMLEAVFQLLDRLHSADARIMAVDDDPQVLELLRGLLQPKDVHLTTLDNPLQFWEAFESHTPDLLVLDVDMPHLSGIELCRVVRNDLRWVEMPIIFLTHHSDAETIHRVFSAGADDFVSKPVVGPELLTRIFNRLEKLRLRRSIAETDALTGAFNRRKATQMIEDFMDLARRHHQPFSLAVIEVEQLKKVNEEHGVVAGDSALQRTGRILQSAFRSEDVFARWSGGVFVAGMYGLSRYDSIERLLEVVEKVEREAFQGPAGIEFKVTLRAGIAQYGEDAADLESLYKAAQAALAEARPGEKTKVSAAGRGQERADGKLDVALVTRDEAHATLLSHTLESRGFHSRWFQDGKMASELLTGSRPAFHAKVILLDIDLPGLDGLTLLKRLAWEGILRESRVIMLITPSVTNEAQTALELGACDYLVKPFNLPVAIQRIRQALDPAD
ncbi:MAG: response regulator [Terriglobia bacterium]